MQTTLSMQQKKLKSHVTVDTDNGHR